MAASSHLWADLPGCEVQVRGADGSVLEENVGKPLKGSDHDRASE